MALKKKRYSVKRRPTPSIMVLLNVDGKKRQTFRAKAMSARRHAYNELGTSWVQPRHR